MARWRRQIQKMTDESVRRYEDELLCGHYLLMVHVRHEEQAWRVCNLLRSHGGHLSHDYGPLIVQQFCPDLEA